MGVDLACRGGIFRGWRQLSDAIAAPSTNALKQSSWYRIRVTRSARSAGVEYRIIQGIQRGLWKWSVETETGTKSGISDSKDAAMAAAKRAIDSALDPKKRKLPPAN